MTTRYTGMNPDGTGNLNDMEHLKQSVRDILITPLASRVMRREYGSLVPDLIDEPMNNTTRLQCMSAAVISLDSPELEIAITTSCGVTMPKSPCAASPGWTKNEGNRTTIHHHTTPRGRRRRRSRGG